MSFEQEPTVIAPPTPLSPTTPSGQTLEKVTALVRFEFEPAKGNDGTKVMMVEWQDDDIARDRAGSWNVSWTGKSTVFPANDDPTDNIRRLYFLLPPGQIIPPHITIAYLPAKASSENEQSEPLRLNVTPLPAIFTPELGATAKASGKKGVLHTIWAKKRLQVLDKEIKSEQEHNLEGIALEMAAAEKEWIEQNFGLDPAARKPSMTIDISNMNAYSSPPQSPALQSPKSPGGGRLTEKLKGLSISTGDRNLYGSQSVNTPTREFHPLSPEVGDMAVSSFSAFRDAPPSASNQAKRIVAQAPPEYIRKQQQQASSLNFVPQLSSQPAQPKSSFTPIEQNQTNDDPDDLFAVALSPRSPDDPKSPFSFSRADIGAFSRIKGTQAS